MPTIPTKTIMAIDDDVTSKVLVKSLEFFVSFMSKETLSRMAYDFEFHLDSPYISEDNRTELHGFILAIDKEIGDRVIAREEETEERAIETGNVH